jgi:hypothetical protein
LYLFIPSQANYLNGHQTKEYKELSNLIIKEKNNLIVAFDRDKETRQNVLGSSTDDNVANLMYLGNQDPNGYGDKHLNKLGQETVANRLYMKLDNLLPNFN